MHKIKLVSNLLFLALVFVACSDYQKVLNKGGTDEQYKMATELYEAGKYKKAVNLFEKVIPKYGNRPQMERIQFMVAKANYEVESYELAAYYFNRFIGNYPSSSKIEEATFLLAETYYLQAPKYSRDQGSTEQALGALQNFIDKFPDSPKVEQANYYFNDLTERLEKKAFENAKLYYTTENYVAAITAFDIFLEENFGTKYKQEALEYKFLASYELGMNSVLSKKEERLKGAINNYERYKKYYPESEKIEDFSDKADKLKEELEDTQELFASFEEAQAKARETKESEINK